MNGKSVFPSITLPCHLSLFYSIPPERHGTVNNTYVPPVHPVTGLFEAAKAAKKTCSMFYGWHPLRNICREGTLRNAEYCDAYSRENSDAYLTERALCCLKEQKPDLCFLYLVETDEKGGHDHGWMSDSYLRQISNAVDQIKKTVEEFGSQYQILITADHGGHDRCHGTDLPEDMTIPILFLGNRFTPGEAKEEISILDLTPTAADILGIAQEREWEGKIIE